MLGKLTFLHKLPLLLKGTSDDDSPCPGYIYEEIAKISHESSGSCQCLLEYLLNRLQSSSCYVKLKVLKILLSLCSHGSPQFIQDLRRNASYIQESADVSGPPDSLHGISLYQKIRATAQEIVGSLFLDISSCPSPTVSSRGRSQAGMGSQTSHPQTLQGFGYSKQHHSLCTTSETLLGGIQKAAVTVSHAVLPGSVSTTSCLSDQVDDSYMPVVIPSGERHTPSGKIVSPCAPNFRASHRSGVPGGGWDESDSGQSSQESSHNKSLQSQFSDAGSKFGSDSQSRSSNRESSESTDRMETAHLSDCQQEVHLVEELIHGCRVFLTQEETQHFIRGCSLLNCEVVFEMLNRSLVDENTCIRLRSLCAISSLMTSDLLSHDHMLAVVRRNLQKLSEGSPGPVTDKATKILRQFEALTRNYNEQGDLNHITAPCLTIPCPLDLLSDIFPHPARGDLLTPANGAPSPTPVLDSSNTAVHCSAMNGAETEKSQNWDSDRTALEVGLRDLDCKEMSQHTEIHCSLSLFEGMEIVRPIRSSDKRDRMTDQTTSNRTVGHADAASEVKPSKSGLPSVFSFLNS
ncbi:AP-4 complex accessory subunit tepsin [Rhinophrynus dorsalis]